jgi:hypothetical protein
MRRVVYVLPIAVRYSPHFVIGRSVCMLPKQQHACNTFDVESTRAPQEIVVTHSLSTSKRVLHHAYGRIVVIGVGEADAIGEPLGMGCAVAEIAVAPATKAPARMMPTNHRFIELVPPCLPRKCRHAAGTQAGTASNTRPPGSDTKGRSSEQAAPASQTPFARPGLNKRGETAHWAATFPTELMGVIELPYSSSVAAETPRSIASNAHGTPSSWPTTTRCRKFFTPSPTSWATRSPWR